MSFPPILLQTQETEPPLSVGVRTIMPLAINACVLSSGKKITMIMPLVPITIF